VIAGIVAWRVSNLSGQVQAASTARTIEAQLVVAALERLVGGSQRRAAGLAALGVLKSTTEKELQYVLTAGSNRWEAHEIKNVRVMVSWFLKGPRLDCGSDQPQINKAAERYKDDWEKKQPRTDGADYGDDGGRANLPSTD
jgi:hypothetical protein